MKMKNLILNFVILLTSLLLNFNSFSQSTERKLVISGQKNVVINKGDIIKIVTYNGNSINGPLGFKDDNTIIINGNNVNIATVSKIRVKDESGYFALGTVVSIIGIGVTAFGLKTISLGYLLIKESWDVSKFLGGFSLSVGIIMTTTGAILTSNGIATMIHGKKYKLKNTQKYKLKIISQTK